MSSQYITLGSTSVVSFTNPPIATAQAVALAGQMLSELRGMEAHLINVSQTGDAQRKGQANSALTALRAAIAAIERQTVLVKEGNEAAAQRIAYIGDKAINGMSDIIAEMGWQGLAANLKQLVVDMYETAKKIPKKVGAQAASAAADFGEGFFSKAPILTAALVLGGGFAAYKYLTK